MISVVLSTYNGSKYIEKQLNSILNQTLLPDEIVICDDHSIDETYEIALSTLKQNQNINVIAHKNNNNVGWKTNFRNALLMTHGDIIFLCDQDDYWYPEKIEKMVKVFEDNTQIGILASNYTLVITEDYQPYTKTASSSANVSMKQFDTNFYMIDKPGCCMAFRRELVNWLEESYWEESCAHDEYLWEIGEIFDKAYILDLPLMDYIRHSSAATHKTSLSYTNRMNFIASKLDSIKRCQRIIEDHYSNVSDSATKINTVENCRKLLESEKAFLEQSNTKNLLQLLRNWKYYQHKTRIFADLYCGLFGKNKRV